MFVAANPGLGLIPFSVTDPAVLFFSVTFVAAVVAPSKVLANDTLLVESETGSNPVPDNGNTCGLPTESSLTTTDP